MFDPIDTTVVAILRGGSFLLKEYSSRLNANSKLMILNMTCLLDLKQRALSKIHDMFSGICLVLRLLFQTSFLLRFRNKIVYCTAGCKTNADVPICRHFFIFRLVSFRHSRERHNAVFHNTPSGVIQTS